MINSNGHIKNKFTPYGLVLYFTIIILELVMSLTPLDEILWDYLDNIGINNVGSHVSNFILSLTILFVLGLVALLSKAPRISIVLSALLLTLSNYIIELYITVFNTKDILDAAYGTGGVIIALLLLVVMDKYGIKGSAA